MSRGMRVAAALAVMAATSSGANVAAAEVPRSWYDLTLSAAAVQPFLQTLPGNDLPLVSVAYSEVALAGWPPCEATGAGYWLGVHEEDAVLENAVPQRNKAGLIGVRNPLAASEVRPQPRSGGFFDWTDAAPALPADGPAGARWTSSCGPNGAAGRATGTELDGPGPRVAGSSVAASREPETGHYVGTARAFVQGLGDTAGRALDAVSTVLRIALPAGAPEPTVSYRLTLVRAAVGASPTAAFDDEALTLAGSDVPASRLAAQFEEQCRAAGGTLGALAGVSILAPAVVERLGGEYLVTSPAVLLTVGVGPTVRDVGGPLALRPAPVADGIVAGLRIGTATFTTRR